MPVQVGLFDSFDNLDQINSSDVARWLKPIPNEIHLENYIANRILYPQTIPQTEVDMAIDLAILREALRINGPKNQTQNERRANTLLGNNPFLNPTLRKILIPERFLSYVSDLATLTWVFIDGLLLERAKSDFFQDLWTVVLTDDSDEVVGSVIIPQFKNGSPDMEIIVEGKRYIIKMGSLTVLPCPKDRCRISYKFGSGGGEVLGKQESAVEIYGGKLGLMIDGRSR